MDIAIALGKKGDDTSAAFERAKSSAGKNSYYAPEFLGGLEDDKLDDSIFIAEATVLSGGNPMPFVEELREDIKKTDRTTIRGGKGPIYLMSTLPALAQIAARYGEMQTAYDLIDENVESHRQFEIKQQTGFMEDENRRGMSEDDKEISRRISGHEPDESEYLKRRRQQYEEKIKEISEKDMSEMTSWGLHEVAEAALESGNVENAMEAIQRSNRAIVIAEIAAKAALVVKDKGEDPTELINLALEKVVEPPTGETARIPYQENHYRGGQIRIMALIGQTVEDPIPVFERAIQMAKELKPDVRSHRSFRSSVWNELAKSIDMRGFDATFAFEQAVDFLELQNGALVAQSRMGEWSDRGGRGVGTWSLYKIDTVELAQSQLDAGYFDLAQKTIDRFRAVDEGRYFTSADEALFNSKRALALASTS